MQARVLIEFEFNIFNTYSVLRTPFSPYSLASLALEFSQGFEINTS
jgi:hypothetical protein